MTLLPTTAEPALLRELAAARLSPTSLDPWEAWKVFKAHLRTPVAGVNDAASFQCGRFDDDGGEAFYVTFVRQFSHYEGEGDEPVRRVVLEFRYPLGQVRPELTADVWTHDFPTLEEFASIVEGLPQFQSAMSSLPSATDVYGEEL